MVNINIFFFGVLIFIIARISAQLEKNPVEVNVLPKNWNRRYTEDELIDEINKLNTTWKAGWNFIPNITLENLSTLVGTIPGGGFLDEPPPLEDLENVSLPWAFDSRYKWRNCPTINDIRNQGCCGSCWAFAAVEVMSDRTCIHSRGQRKVRLSPQNILSCCRRCGGCQGGYVEYAFRYWVQSGIVTGGDYGSREGCQPYSINGCGRGGVEPSPRCQRGCQRGYRRRYWEDLNFGSRVYNIRRNEAQIRQEIYNNGPVVAVFAVYSDFMMYRSGVYQYRRGVQAGHHAVKIIGWGIESGTPYWLVANSWGIGWGERGFFKIRRGNNECEIENIVYAGLPRR